MTDSLLTTADYALIVSLFSMVVSLGALIWNVWQKFIFVKPALQVTFGVYTILEPGRKNGGPRQQILGLYVTNMGPGPVIRMPA